MADPAITEPYDLLDREYISRYATATFGVVILDGNGDPTTPGEAVVVDMVNDAGDNTVFSGRATTSPQTGTYEVAITPADTQTPDNYELRWEWDSGNATPEYKSFFVVGASAPAYDALSGGMKLVVEQTYIRFADLFDSPYGGPHLQTYFQAHFGRNRMAQLLGRALARLNTVSQPYQSYTTDTFPVEQWGDVLEFSLYIETIKHLIRSYTEQPSDRGITVAVLDRRDYVDRWRQILQMEERDFEQMKDTYKIANMGLGRPAVLVSGGVYGDYGPTRLPGSAAARPKYYYTFYT